MGCTTCGWPPAAFHGIDHRPLNLAAHPVFNPPYGLLIYLALHQFLYDDVNGGNFGSLIKIKINNLCHSDLIC